MSVFRNTLVALLAVSLASACSVAPVVSTPAAPPASSTPPAPPSIPPAAPPEVGAPAATIQRYESSAVDFANPERGFYQQESPLWLRGERQPLQTAALNALRPAGVSTMRLYLMIDAYRDAAIPTAMLEYLQSQFDMARAAGLKIIPRFAYAYPKGGSYPFKEPDAPVERVLAHIAQLEPLLRDNADLVSFMEMGFIGAWGEWHSSTNGLVNTNGSVNADSRRIVARLLEALPKSRMLALRYPPHKQQLLGDAPLISSEAYSGSDRARVGAHNDCFLASDTDWGTYSSDAKVREATKSYLAADNLYLPQGGETCNDGADAKPYIGCVNALGDLERLHYSALNRGYLEAVYAGWQKEGCLDDVKRRLGYRLALLESSLPPTAQPGQSLALSISLKNEGFAAPFNPRGVALVLRDSKGNVSRQTLNDGLSTPSDRAFDPRFWLPGQTVTLNATLTLPATLEPGSYQVLLHLYDPAPKLRDRPEYAVQLANADVWDAQTGMNKLRVLEVKR